jgi:hypothetical protein
MNPSSEEVGEKVASALGEGPNRATLAAQRVRIMEMAQASFRPRPGPNLRALALALVPVAVVAAAIALFVTRDRAFDAHFHGVGVEVDARIVANDGLFEPLDFSDGSRITLEPRAAATLSELTPKHAGLRVDGGRVLANIRKHPGVTWTVSAGPYAVHVVGTRFSVAWSAGERALEVLVHEGRVRVTGGDLPEAGVVLDAGGRLERRAVEPRAEIAARPSVSDGPKNLEPVAEKNVEAAPLASANADISALATKGKYKEALALAEKRGFERLTNELPENDLLLLANAARFSGDAARARLALLKLRQRFGGRPGANLAALYLAKIAEDMTHEPQEAVRWLRTFLQSSPSGDLAAGARASLMSLLLRSGDEARARAIAEEYLRYHATGPHADEARALVRE